jgi:hypothetical protein
MRGFLGALIGIGAATVAHAQTIDDFKTMLAAKARTDCLLQQRGAAANAGIPDGLIMRFCDCFAERVRATVTPDDVSPATGPTMAYRNKMTAMAVQCGREGQRKEPS